MKTIIITVVFILSAQITVLGNTFQTTPKLSNPNKTKKGNASYEMSKELRKTRKTTKPLSSEVNSSNNNPKKAVNTTQISA